MARTPTTEYDLHGKRGGVRGKERGMAARDPTAKFTTIISLTGGYRRKRGEGLLSLLIFLPKNRGKKEGEEEETSEESKIS